MKREELFSVPDLKDRHWTDAAIRDALGRHDDERPNPYSSRVGAPMRLYAKKRVIEVEQTKEWQTWLIASLQRREASKKGVQSKREKLLAMINKLQVPLLTGLSQEELYRRAVEHYNSRNAFGDKYASLHSSNWDFLKRIADNYLRHMCSGYEAALKQLVGKTGREEAYEVIREKIDAAILEAYPFLGEFGESDPQP